MTKIDDGVSATTHDRFVARLARREPLLGTLLTLPSPEVAEVMAAAGFDWLFVDMEHGLFDFAAVQRVVQAAGHLCPCIVRVPTGEPILIAKALDTGAAGIIVPHVNTADEARADRPGGKVPAGRGAQPRRGARAGLRRPDCGRDCPRQRSGRRGRAGRTRRRRVAHRRDRRRARRERRVHRPVRPLGQPRQARGDRRGRDVQEAIGTIAAACAARPVACGIFVVGGAAANRAFAAGHSLVCAMTDTLLLADAAARLRSAALLDGSGARG